MQPKKPLKPTPVSKGPYEKRGGIPREKFPYFLKRGPLSIPWSRQMGSRQQKALGEKLLKERFPRQTYGSDISGREIQREINKIIRYDLPRAKTNAERIAIKQGIARLEEVKKRAGL